MKTFDTNDDVIDSHEVIERLEVLRAAKTCAQEELDELAALEALDAKGRDRCPDWTHGETLVRESHF